MKWFVNISLACALVLFTSATSAKDNPIVLQVNAFNKAYNAHDAGAIALLYTEKGAVFPPRSKAIVGRVAITAHYKTAFGQGVSDLKYKVTEIRQTGTATALEIGIAIFKAGAKTITGRSMRLWRMTDGKWLLHRDMYHILSVQ